MKRRALISVSDKTGVIEFARRLRELGWEILSTGGTAKAIREAGIPVLPVSDVTGFPEILEGRVKTLHPLIHGGILAKRTPEHMAELAEHKITPIDLVAVNLYPFAETIAKPGVELDEALENIDIGGPTMIRAAAKNFPAVIIAVNPGRYGDIISQLATEGDVDLKMRRELAAEAFAHTAAYDKLISGYLGEDTGFSGRLLAETKREFPKTFLLQGEKVCDLRYGENPHQQAAFYRGPGDMPDTVTGAARLQGKELSFNNILDLDAALELVRELPTPAAAVIKHNNPCGAAVGQSPVDAYLKAYQADSVSAYGGIVGLNTLVDEDTAAEMVKTFLEAIIAPDFTPGALKILAQKPNLRVLRTGALTLKPTFSGLDVKKVRGGFLVQEQDFQELNLEQLRVATGENLLPEDIWELLFAWKVVKHVKSNAIVITNNLTTLGIGAGQMNRVGAARIALEQAGERAKGAYLASDGFLPFADTVDKAAQAGIKMIIQPGGSVRDDEVVQRAKELGLVMVITGMRHFKH